MKNSNLAERLEEFTATVDAPKDSRKLPAFVLAFVPDASRASPPSPPRRSAFGARRIVIRDDGFRLFRVS